MKTRSALSHFFFAAMLMMAWGVDAQQYDKVWVLGTPMAAMTFETDTIINSQLPDTTLLSFLTIGSMCDKAGNLLFYTNGIKIYNRLGVIMPNGDSLSAPSEYYNLVEPQGMPSRQGIVILPKPGDSNLYYLFHYTPTDTLDIADGAGYEALNLYYTILDMRSDSGRGAVTIKNVPLIQNELLSFSRLAACKHANGRDWWIVKNAWHENIYYEFLLTPDGVQGPFIQQIGPSYSMTNESGAYSLFSPDGSKYVSFTSNSLIVKLDFDRCTGLFSNRDSFFNNNATNPNINHVSGGASAAISPNGRFLYINNRLELNQYDLWAPHIQDSVRIETLLETIDFYEMDILQLAPNDKIYVSCYNGGSYKMHVINQPDSFGLACNFQMYTQPTTSQNPYNLPYFPNYRLGALAGSACDTLTAISDIEAAHPAFAAVTPNPASDHAVLVYYTGSNTANQAEMYDATGRLVWSKTMTGSSGTVPIDLRGFSAGVYMVRFVAGDRVLLSGKVVVE